MTRTTSIQKYFFTKEELENKFIELGFINNVADFYNVPRSSMRYLFKQHKIKYKARPNQIEINEEFFKVDSPESFYLSGFIAADGNIEKNSNRIIIALANKDEKFLYNIKELILAKNNIRTLIQKNNRNGKIYNDSIICSLRFSSKVAVKYLNKFNIVSNKTKTYTFPEWLINHPWVHHFIRGYFDGDGSVYICKEKDSDCKYIGFNIIGNKEFLETCQNILINKANLNINKITKDRNVYKLKYAGTNVSDKMYKFLYKDASFYLKRKYDKFTVLK